MELGLSLTVSVSFRHEERIESLHEKLEDAKMALQGVKVVL